MSTETSHDNAHESLPINFVGMTGRGDPEFQAPLKININNSLNEILAYARQQNASDVHLGALKPIIFRQVGQLKNVTSEALDAELISTLISSAIPKDVLEEFERTGDAEYVHTIKGYGRFRMALMKQRDGWDLTARVIPMEIPKFESTGMPASCAGLTKWAQGLVLITGPAGCGKTTTLASLIELINQSRHDHIISIEEPIEIVYEPKKCQVTQREIKTHTLSQNNSLRAALREDPDILVVSELRDLSTIQLAITASETGHLVFGTMNTINATQTVSSVIDSFPAEEQGIVRNMISESLRGVICQQLIPKKDGSGMIAAFEVLIITPPVANMIRSNKIPQISNTMATSTSMGMILMDNYLENLAKKGLISNKEACERATNSAAMVQLLVRATIPKAKFLEIGPTGSMILNDLIQFGVLEEASISEVRLRANTKLDENFIKKVAKTDFDKIWAILQ